MLIFAADTGTMDAPSAALSVVREHLHPVAML